MRRSPDDTKQPTKKQRLGARAESIVCEDLAARGYAIVDRNVRVGRNEIDIIARRGRLVIFCEVRARARPDFVSPLATIDAAKVRRVRSAAADWMRAHRCPGDAMRLDAAAVTFAGDPPQIDYVEDAF
jgi:putative endonuclease